MKLQKTMNKNLYLMVGIVFFTSLLFLPFISAEVFGYTYLESGTNLNPSINYSTTNVNASEYWVTAEGDLGDVADISHSWLADLAWSVAGHTIDTDFLPDTTLSYDLGSGVLRWGDLYVSDISADNISVYDIIARDLDISGEITSPYGNFTELFVGGANISDTYVNIAGDTMTGDLRMTNQSIENVGHLLMDADSDIWFGSVNARIYSGGTNYINIHATDTIDLDSNNEIKIKPDNDANNWIQFGIKDLPGTTGDRPYIQSYRANLELRPENGLVIVTGNITADWGFFGWLGSAVSRITKGWFVDLDIEDDVEIGGDLNVTGKIYNSLAHVFGLATETFTVANADTWYNISMNRSHADVEGFALSDDNITIVVTHDGHYTIIFGMGFIDTSEAQGTDVGMRIELNGVELKGSYIEDDTQKKDADKWQEHTTHAELSEGDKIRLQYIASADTVTIEQEDTYATQGFSAFGYIQEIII